MIYHGKVFYSPPSVFSYIEEIRNDPTYKFKNDFEKQKVEEISVGSIIALIMYAISGHPAYVQLHKPEPPDVIVRLLDTNDISQGLITLLELTDYLKGSKETLLEQLTRKKIAEKYDPYGEEYIVGVMVEPGAIVDTEPLRIYLEQNNKNYPVWLVEQKQFFPDTIVELTIVNPVTSKQIINVGKIANDYIEKGHVGIHETRRVGSKEKSRFEKIDKKYPPPWEMIGK